MSQNNQNEQLPWFSCPGPYEDVIISTRCRISRNLADFPFPSKLSEDDLQRVNSLVYDAFNENPHYHFIDFNNISYPGRDILKDKNIIKDVKNFSCSAVVLDENESTTCLVNEKDHVKIASFVSGLDCEKAMENTYKVDEFLQKKLQFAASYDFGYLTTFLKDCGTGMKITIRIFIPGIIMAGKFDSIIALVQEKNLCIQPVYKMEGTTVFGCCIFDIFPGSSSRGTELDQLAVSQSIGLLILKTERKIRSEFADNNPTIVHNFVNQSYAKAMYSLLLSYEDVVNIISGIKWGLQLGVIEGISEDELNALYYRTKHGHLLYLSENYPFTYEQDLKSDQEMQIERLRTIVIQQAFEHIQFKK